VSTKRIDKLLVHLVARGGRRDALLQHLPALAEEWLAGASTAPGRTTVLAALVDDPMRATGLQQPTRAFDATLEWKRSSDDAQAGFCGAVRGLADSLDDLVQADLCAAQLGTDKVFIDSEPMPIRYQYCMRRRHDFTAAQYLERYESIHSRFGIETRGIEGYAQLHIDPDVSLRACSEAGFGYSRTNSVSELHMQSLEAFFAHAKHNAGIGATEDEDRFVDRANSLAWNSEAIARSGSRTV